MKWEEIDPFNKGKLIKKYIKAGFRSLDAMEKHWNDVTSKPASEEYIEESEPLELPDFKNQTYDADEGWKEIMRNTRKHANGGHLYGPGGKNHNIHDYPKETYTFVTPSWGNTGYVVPGTTPETSSTTVVSRSKTETDIDREQGLHVGTTHKRNELERAQKESEYKQAYISEPEYSKEVQDEINEQQQVNRILKPINTTLDVAEYTPVIGDAISFGRGVSDLTNGYTTAGLIGLGSVTLPGPINKIVDNLKFIKKANKLMPEYIPISKLNALSTKQTEKAVRKRITENNRFVRGVRDSIREEDKEATNKILKEKYGIENPTELDRLEYYATTYAPQTGAGRAGMSDLPPSAGPIYTSNSLGFAKGYAEPVHHGEKEGLIAVVEQPFTLGKDRWKWFEEGNVYRKLKKYTAQDEAKQLAADRYFLDKYGVSRSNATPHSGTQESYMRFIQAQESLPDLYKSSSDVSVSDIKDKLGYLRYIFSMDEQYEIFKDIVNSAKGHITLNDAMEEVTKRAHIPLGLEREKETVLNLLNNKHKRKIIFDDYYGRTLPLEYINYPDIYTTESLKNVEPHQNAYQHYIFVGPVGEKGLNLVKWIDPKSIKGKGTRFHTGESSEGLSRKQHAQGGPIKTKDPYQHFLSTLPDLK